MFTKLLPELAAAGIPGPVAVRAVHEDVELQELLAARREAEALLDRDEPGRLLGEMVQQHWAQLGTGARTWLRLRSALQTHAWLKLVESGVPEECMITFLEQADSAGEEDLRSAATWVSSGIYPEERAAWRGAGLDRAGALRWRAVCNPEEAAVFRAQGWDLTRVRAELS